MSQLKMPDINSVIIAGHLTCDPSFRKTTNGTPVANFYVTCNRKFKDNNGQWRENVCYVGIVAWYKLAESCYESLKRGSAVLVDGELQSRTWKTENGDTRNVVEIKARRIQFLNKKTSSEGFSEGVVGDEDTELESTDLVGFDEGAMESESAKAKVQAPAIHPREEEVPATDFDFGYRGLKL